LVSENLINAIAIDGPAASGKSTIGYLLANRIQYLYLDTGCMYRAVTLAALNAGIQIGDEEQVSELARQLPLEIKAADYRESSDGRLYTVIMNNRDVTWDLRTTHVDVNVSQVSAYPEVRRNLAKRQRAIGVRGKVVMVGRDIGTVVLPDAALKLYLVASAEERARRRWQERETRLAEDTYEQILADIKRRDQFDGSRIHSPMRPASDAILIDTTDRQPEQIIEEILKLDYFHT
jgi:cytidylate kinase